MTITHNGVATNREMTYVNIWLVYKAKKKKPHQVLPYGSTPPYICLLLVPSRSESLIRVGGNASDLQSDFDGPVV